MIAKSNRHPIGQTACAALTAALLLTPPAHAQELDWIRQFGTSDRDSASALAPDGAGGVMVAGATFGSLGGPNAGSHDVFLARYDGAGDRLWIRQFGTSDGDFPRALALDGAGGVVVAGWTSGSLGGPNTGGRDAFLARYDSAGERLWTRQFGTSEQDEAYALTPDGSGGVTLAGLTTGSLGGPNAGAADAFLARYDSAGDRLWMRQFGTSARDLAVALAPDGAGGVMVAGWTEGSLGGPNAGLWDGFLARYDSAGDRLWIIQFGMSEAEGANALVTDGADGVMLAGSTTGSLSGQNAGGQDAFLARYDSAGDRLWIRQFGTSGSDTARALAPDGAGGVMVAGWTSGSLGGPNAGGADAFLARYDSAGERLWIRQFGTDNLDVAGALAPDGAGGVLIAGTTTGSLGGQNAGEGDAFLARYAIDSCDPCDMNCDGEVDAFDIEPFLDLLFNGAAPCNTCTGDVNADGNINAFDIEPFLSCLFP